MSVRRRYDFVTLVQTIVLHQHPPLEIAIKILETAMSLPEEAIPSTHLRDAAFELWQWKMGREAPPKYIQDYEAVQREAEAEKTRAVIIRINRDVECDPWWLMAENFSASLPKSCIDIVCGRGIEHITVSRKDAEQFRDWGEQIHGWHDGPPFIFENADGSAAFQ